MDSSRGISDNDFREVLSSMSEWYDRHGYINKLKVLFRDLVTEPEQCYSATKVAELFELLRTSGHLSHSNLNVIYDTINITQPFGLEPEILKLSSSKCWDIRTVNVSTFTCNRKELIKMVEGLDDDGVKKISQLYNCPEKDDICELFVNLEHRGKFCETNLDDFMKNITTFLITVSHKNPLGLRESDMGIATREGSPRKSTDNVCIVTNMDIKDNKGTITGIQLENCITGQINIFNTTNVLPTQCDQEAPAVNDHQVTVNLRKGGDQVFLIR